MTERQPPPPSPEAQRKTNIERERRRQLSGEHPTVGTGGAAFDQMLQELRATLPPARPAKDFTEELKAKAAEHQPMKHFQTTAEIRAALGKTEKSSQDPQNAG